MTDKTNDQTNAAKNDSSKQDTQKPKKKKRRLLKVFACLFILFVLFVALLPTLVSTGFGTGVVLSFVNKSLPGEVVINDLNVGWFSGTSVRGLQLKDPDGKVIIAADADAPDVSLISLIRGNMSLGDVTLTTSEVYLEQYKDGTLNLDRAIGPSEKKDKEPGTFPKGLVVILTLDTAKATFQPYNQEPATLTDAKLNVNIASGQQISAKLVGNIQQGPFGGSIYTETDLVDLFDAEGKLQLAKLKIKLDDNKINLPTKLVDGLVARGLVERGGALFATTGESIKATYSANGSLSDLKANLNVATDRMKINANASIQLDDQQQLKGLTLDDGELLRIQINKSMWDKLTQGAKTDTSTRVEFVRADDLVITNSRVAIKPGPNGIDQQQSTLMLTVSPVNITIRDAKLGEQTLSLNALNVNYDGPSRKVTATINADTGQGNDTGTFIVNANVENPFNSDGSLNVEKLTMAVDAEVKDFALSLLDQIFLTDGLLAKVIGGKLNASVNMNLKPAATGGGGGNEGTWSVIAKSDQLDANLGGPLRATPRKTDSGVEVDNVVMKLGQPGRVSTKLSKPLLDLLRSNVKGIEPLLEQANLTDVGATLTLNNFETKLASPIKDTLLATAKADMALTFDPIQLALKRTPAPVGPAETPARPDIKIQLQNLTATATFAGNTQPVNVGITSSAQYQGQTAKLNIGATVRDLFNNDGQIDTDTLKATINATLSNVPTALADTFMDQGDLVEQGLGSTISITLKTDADLQKKSDAYAYTGNGNVTIKSTNADVKLTGKLTGDRLVLNTAPDASYATLTVTPAFAKAFQSTSSDKSTSTSTSTSNQAEASKWNIAKATPVNITFTKADFPIGGDMSSAVLALTAAMPELALTGDDRFNGASVKDFKVTVAGNTVGKQLDVRVDGRLLHLNEEGKLTVTAAIMQPLGKTPGIAADVNIENAPTALADAFANQNGLIGALEGKAIKSVALSYKRTGNVPDTFGVNIQSATIQGGVAGTYTPGQGFATAPNQRLSATISKQAWPIIQNRFGKDMPDILRDAKEVSGSVTIDLTTLNLALKDVKAPAKQAHITPATTTRTAITTAPEAPVPPTIDATVTKIIAAESRIAINITSNDLYIERKDSKRAVKFENVVVKIDAAESLQKANMLVTATPVSIPLVNGLPVNAAAPQAEQIKRGELKIEGTIHGLADKDGFFTTNTTAVNGTAEARSIPMIELDEALGQQGKFVALFGDMVDAKAVVDTLPGKPGKLALNLESGNATASVNGAINDNVITLNEDAKASLKVTPAMSDVLLKSVLVIVKAVSAENPATLTIPAKGFSVPLNRGGEGGLVDMKKVNASADLKLGTLNLEKSGPLGQVVSLLGQHVKEFRSIGKDWNAAFTDGDVSLAKGIVTYNKPMRMSLNNITFVFNGSVDLNTRSIAKLDIGIDGVTFAKVKGLNQVFKPGSILPLPIGGTVDNPVLDEKKFVGSLIKAIGGSIIPGLLNGNKGGLPDLGGLGDLIPGNKPKENQPQNNPPKDGKNGENANPDGEQTREKTKEEKIAEALGNIFGKPKKQEEKKEEPKNEDQKPKSGDDGKGILEGLIGGDTKKDNKDTKKE